MTDRIDGGVESVEELVVKDQTAAAANALPGSEWSVAVALTWTSYDVAGLSCADGWNVICFPSGDHEAVPATQAPPVTRTPNEPGFPAAAVFIPSDQVIQTMLPRPTWVAPGAGEADAIVGAVESTSNAGESTLVTAPRESRTVRRTIVSVASNPDGVHDTVFEPDPGVSGPAIAPLPVPPWYE